MARSSGSAISALIKLLIVCFLVGTVMAAFQVTPQTVLTTVVGWLQSIAPWLRANLGGFMANVMMGAAIVIPIWIIWYLFSARGDDSGESK